MATVQVVERKVQHLGTWTRDSVDNRVIDEIKQKILTDKGPKVKLQLSGDGLRVLKTSMIQGKMLIDFIPIARLQFFTVVKTAPEVVFIVSLGGGELKFSINVFRFANGMDASYFSQSFRKVVTSAKKVTVVRQVANVQPQDDEINWTLRNKEQDNSKRQLSKMVDMTGQQTVVTTHVTEGGGQGEVIANGNHNGELYGNRIHMYRKGKPPTRIERESLESEFSDNRSEVSEGALRVELESLSQELRDIKLMLEKSTGITASSEPGSPRDFEPVNVKVHHHSVNPETVVVRQEAAEDNIDAVVITDDEVQMRPKLNGYTTVQNGDVTHIRVSVPDYRTVSDRTATTRVTTTSSVPVSEPSHYEIVETRKMRPSTTSYENWKRNTMDRHGGRKFNDFPERIQWRSRGSSNRASHVMTARPRSAIPAFSTDATDSSQLVEVRHHNAGLGASYQRVSFNPRVVKVHDRQTQSLRVKGLSTTVAKPIDRVYVGRPDAKHHSLSYRHRGAEVRPSILVQDNPNTVYVEQNNNLVKPAENEEGPLDVSEIDLYRETSVEGAVIRT